MHKTPSPSLSPSPSLRKKAGARAEAGVRPSATGRRWIAVALAFVTAAAYVLINLVVDVLYAFIDPRIRYG